MDEHDVKFHRRFTHSITEMKPCSYVSDTFGSYPLREMSFRAAALIGFVVSIGLLGPIARPAAGRPEPQVPARASSDLAEVTTAFDRVSARLLRLETRLAATREAIRRIRISLVQQDATLEALREDQAVAFRALALAQAHAGLTGDPTGLAAPIDLASISDYDVRAVISRAQAEGPGIVSGLTAYAWHTVQRIDVQLDYARKLWRSLNQHLARKQTLMSRQRASATRVRLLRSRVVLHSLELASLRERVATVERRIEGSKTTGPFDVCPVDPPRVIADDFGAPRYGGGYHRHAGNDILAPRGTPIRAPFAGIAEVASNPLGGLAVRVHGQRGYVYNAHLSKIGKLGRVEAGDIVGYVGTSGNAVGGPPHNHFEWHPKNPRGAETINGAVDPHAALLAACGR